MSRFGRDPIRPQLVQAEEFSLGSGDFGVALIAREPVGPP
jgi:hypothetical protein